MLSDFAAWPNPFSIANNLMGFLLPTYILRGVDASNLTPQLTTQLTGHSEQVGTGPLALNLYLTLPRTACRCSSRSTCLTDLTNLLTLGAFPNPLGTLANALSPALTSLVNLGYTDVKRMPDGTYVRTLDQAGDPSAFFSFPDVNWAQVPGDIVNLLVKGFTKEFFSGNPTPGTPNAITGVFKLLSSILGGGGFGSFGGIADLINAIVGGLNPFGAVNPFGGFDLLAANESRTPTPRQSPFRRNPPKRATRKCAASRIDERKFRRGVPNRTGSGRDDDHQTDHAEAGRTLCIAQAEPGRHRRRWRDADSGWGDRWRDEHCRWGDRWRDEHCRWGDRRRDEHCRRSDRRPDQDRRWLPVFSASARRRVPSRRACRRDRYPGGIVAARTRRWKLLAT